MSCLRFGDTQAAVTFTKLLAERGLDVSTQTYKPDCPPSVLTKLPLIAGADVADFVLDRMTSVLRAMKQ
jgi:predicted transcriptional regulator